MSRLIKSTGRLRERSRSQPRERARWDDLQGNSPRPGNPLPGLTARSLPQERCPLETESKRSFSAASLGGGDLDGHDGKQTSADVDVTIHTFRVLDRSVGRAAGKTAFLGTGFSPTARLIPHSGWSRQNPYRPLRIEEGGAHGLGCSIMSPTVRCVHRADRFVAWLAQARESQATLVASEKEFGP